jgi:hypothetical protein
MMQNPSPPTADMFGVTQMGRVQRIDVVRGGGESIQITVAAQAVIGIDGLGLWSQMVSVVINEQFALSLRDQLTKILEG